MSVLKELASSEHPYYCSSSNYYSNEPHQRYETATEFLDELEDADIDMNLVFRWDVTPRGETGAETGRYSAEVFMIKQRKGIFSPIDISHINEAEAVRFKEYLSSHYEVLKQLWSPISQPD